MRFDLAITAHCSAEERGKLEQAAIDGTDTKTLLIRYLLTILRQHGVPGTNITLEVIDENAPKLRRGERRRNLRLVSGMIGHA